jgi:hypothetical protein
MGAQCKYCGKEISFWSASIGDRESCPKCAPKHASDPGKIKGLKEAEFKACVDGLGLLEGEEMGLHFVCLKQEVGAPSVWNGQRTVSNKKGLLVFTNDNMIFMQQEGSWSSNYSQALRFPIENICGVSTSGSLIKHVRILVGTGGNSDFFEFMPFAGQGTVDEIRRSVETHLKEMRQQKKQLAQEVLSKGTAPLMIFCKFCGARNKSDRSNCANCGAVLT